MIAAVNWSLVFWVWAGVCVLAILFFMGSDDPNDDGSGSRPNSGTGRR